MWLSLLILVLAVPLSGVPVSGVPVTGGPAYGSEGWFPGNWFPGTSFPGTLSQQTGAREQAVRPPDGDRRSASLRALRSRVERLESELRAAALEADDLLDRARHTRLEVELQEARVAEAVAARDRARAAIHSSGEEIGRLEVAVAETAAELGRRLVSISTFGQGHLRLLLALDGDAELLPSLRLLRFLVRRDRDAVLRYRSLRSDLVVERARLAAEEEEAAEWLAAERARRRQLAQLEQKQRRLLAELERRRARLAASVDRLARKEARLSRLLEVLVDDGERLLPGVPIHDFRGALAWPAEGRVTIEFGPRRDPVYRTTVPHNGIELETVPASPVTVVYPGKVLYSAVFQDLGFTVVVQHAGGALSLYAGLSEVSVSEGDVLALDTHLGRAGPRLYFEIRVDRRPENPREWLL